MKTDLDREKHVYEVTQFEESRPRVSPALVYLASLGSEDSRRVQRQSLKAISLLFGEEPLERVQWHKIRYRHVVAVRSFLAENYAPSSANRMLAALRGVLKTCGRMKLMSRDDLENALDVRDVKGRREAKGRMLTKEEIRSLFETCDQTTDAGARNAAMLTLACRAGLRRAEISKMRAEDVSVADGFVRVIGKGNKQRDIHLSPSSMEPVLTWMRRRGAWRGPLFYAIKPMNGERKHITCHAIFLMFREMAKKAGVKDFSPHDLRRTFASLMLESGVDLRTVQEMMGHENANTTGKYDRRGAKAKKRAAEILSDALDSK